MQSSLMQCQCSEKWADVGTLVLRIALGAIFLYHGYDKVFTMGIPQVAGFLSSLGFPVATAFAYILAYGELIAGILLILGLCTHWAAKFGVIVGAVALVLVHIENGFAVGNGGVEFMLLIFAASLSVMISGPGVYSLDAKMRGNDSM